MSTWDFRKLLENMAEEISNEELQDTDEKFLAVQDDRVTVAAAKSTVDELQAKGGAIVGPLRIVANIGENVGWYRTPQTTQVLITKEVVTVVIPQDGLNPSRVDEYTTDKFAVFLVIVEKTDPPAPEA